MLRASPTNVAHMSFEVELLPGAAVISVRFFGTATLSERAAAMEDVVQRQVESRARKLLVDLAHAQLVDASNAETFEYATRLAREPVIRGMRIAYVGDCARAASIETLAALRGYFYQRFPTRAAAMRWLEA